MCFDQNNLFWFKMTPFYAILYKIKIKKGLDDLSPDHC